MPKNDPPIKNEDKNQSTMIAVHSNGNIVMFHSDSLVLTNAMDSTQLLLNQLEEKLKQKLNK